MYRIVLFLCLLTPIGPWAPEFPNLRVEAPPELAAARTHLESISPARLSDIAELLSIADAGRDIRIVLATENSNLARSVAPWIAGFAVGESNLIVIFPARSPGYSDHTIDNLLRHALATDV